MFVDLFPDDNEGALTRKSQQFLTNEFLDKFGKNVLQLDNYILTTKNDVGRPVFYCDHVEALIGAIFRDSGKDYKPVERFVLKYFEEEAKKTLDPLPTILSRRQASTKRTSSFNQEPQSNNGTSLRSVTMDQTHKYSSSDHETSGSSNERSKPSIPSMPRSVHLIPPLSALSVPVNDKPRIEERDISRKEGCMNLHEVQNALESIKSASEERPSHDKIVTQKPKLKNIEKKKPRYDFILKKSGSPNIRLTLRLKDLSNIIWKPEVKCSNREPRITFQIIHKDASQTLNRLTPSEFIEFVEKNLEPDRKPISKIVVPLDLVSFDEA